MPLTKIDKINEFKAHEFPIRTLALGHKSGQVLASAADDKKINLWAIGQSQCIISIDTTELNGTATNVLRFGHSDELVISGHENGFVNVWNLQPVEAIRTFNGNKESAIRSLDITSNAILLASGSSNGTININDMRSASCVAQLKHYGKPLSCIRFSPDNKWLATASEDSSIKIWDLSTRRILCELRDHLLAVNRIEFHPTHLIMASSSRDRMIKIWDLDKFEIISSSLQEKHAYSSFSYNLTGDLLAASHSTGLKLFNAEPFEGIDEVKSDWKNVVDMVAVAQSQLIAASFTGKSISTYAIDTNNLVILPTTTNTNNNQKNIDNNNSGPSHNFYPSLKRGAGVKISSNAASPIAAKINRLNKGLMKSNNLNGAGGATESTKVYNSGTLDKSAEKRRQLLKYRRSMSHLQSLAAQESAQHLLFDESSSSRSSVLNDSSSNQQHKTIPTTIFRKISLTDEPNLLFGAGGGSSFSNNDHPPNLFNNSILGSPIYKSHMLIKPDSNGLTTNALPLHSNLNNSDLDEKIKRLSNIVKKGKNVLKSNTALDSIHLTSPTTNFPPRFNNLHTLNPQKRTFNPIPGALSVNNLASIITTTRSSSLLFAANRKLMGSSQRNIAGTATNMSSLLPAKRNNPNHNGLVGSLSIHNLSSSAASSSHGGYKSNFSKTSAPAPPASAATKKLTGTSRERISYALCDKRRHHSFKDPCLNAPHRSINIINSSRTSSKPSAITTTHNNIVCSQTNNNNLSTTTIISTSSSSATNNNNGKTKSFEAAVAQLPIVNIKREQQLKPSLFITRKTAMGSNSTATNTNITNQEKKDKNDVGVTVIAKTENNGITQLNVALAATEIDNISINNKDLIFQPRTTDLPRTPPLSLSPSIPTDTVGGHPQDFLTFSSHIDNNTLPPPPSATTSGASFVSTKSETLLPPTFGFASYSSLSTTKPVVMIRPSSNTKPFSSSITDAAENNHQNYQHHHHPFIDNDADPADYSTFFSDHHYGHPSFESEGNSLPGSNEIRQNATAEIYDDTTTTTLLLNGGADSTSSSRRLNNVTTFRGCGGNSSNEQQQYDWFNPSNNNNNLLLLPGGYQGQHRGGAAYGNHQRHNNAHAHHHLNSTSRSLMKIDEITSSSAALPTYDCYPHHNYFDNSIANTYNRSAAAADSHHHHYHTFGGSRTSFLAGSSNAAPTGTTQQSTTAVSPFNTRRRNRNNDYTRSSRSNCYPDPAAVFSQQQLDYLDHDPYRQGRNYYAANRHSSDFNVTSHHLSPPTSETSPEELNDDSFMDMKMFVGGNDSYHHPLTSSILLHSDSRIERENIGGGSGHQLTHHGNARNGPSRNNPQPALRMIHTDENNNTKQTKHHPLAPFGSRTSNMAGTSHRQARYTGGGSRSDLTSDLSSLLPLTNNKLHNGFKSEDSRQHPSDGGGIPERFQNSNSHHFSKFEGSSSSIQQANNNNNNNSSFSSIITMLENENITSSHLQMSEVLANRVRHLRMAKNLCRNNADIKTALSTILDMNEESVLYDVLNLFLNHSHLWTLDISLVLLPHVTTMLNHKHETYMSLACKVLKTILKNFGPLIKATINRIPGLGVDLSREERLRKCNACFKQLITAKSYFDQSIAFGGKLGKEIKDVQILLQTIE